MKTKSNVELIQIITGQRSLDKISKFLDSTGTLNELVNLTCEEIIDKSELTEKEAKRIEASIEFSKRVLTAPKKEKYNINDPEDVANLFMAEYKDLPNEHFSILIIDTKHKIISKEVISIGNINSAIVDPREVFCQAIKKNAACITLLHNHPSGNPEPSSEDLKITERIVECGNILGIRVVDHVIIGDGIFHSMRRSKLVDFEKGRNRDLISEPGFEKSSTKNQATSKSKNNKNYDEEIER